MALIPCPECRKRVSEHAKSCPRCGYEPGYDEGAWRKLAEAERKAIQERKNAVFDKDWQKLFKLVIWVISIVFPTYLMLRTDSVIKPIIWIQGFVLIWLFYLIVFLITSPVRIVKEKLFSTQKDSVRRFKNWLSQSQQDSE